ncbi:hypothetical protein [Mesorhizobium sp. KR9-304]|uniref:hypothetical protein n=1 Tax=Mesorhizobium sp. KR9-304 TaxID=3156614 RepID=UPI0032B3588D
MWDSIDPGRQETSSYSAFARVRQTTNSDSLPDAKADFWPMNIAGDLADFGNWWLSETTDTLTAVSRRRQSRVDYRIRAGSGAVHVERPATGEVIELSLDDLGQNLRRFVKRSRTKDRRWIELVLEAGRFLERPLSAFRLPKRRAGAGRAAGSVWQVDALPVSAPRCTSGSPQLLPEFI